MRQINSRYEPTEEPVTTMIRILRGGKWYQMRPLDTSVDHSRTVISRLRRKGRVVEVAFLTGMGLA